MSLFSLQARWVLPIERPPIAGGVVTIADGKITALGDRPPAEGPLHDLGEVVLMPGLVNAHTHLEFSQLDKPLGRPGMPLPEWIRLVIAGRQRNKHSASNAIASGLQESSRHGVTTLGDIASTPASRLVPEPEKNRGRGRHGSPTGNLPQKNVLAPQQITFQEVIGFSTARIDSVLAEVRQRLQSSRDLTDRRSNPPPPKNQGLSPHAPYTVHPELLERLVDLACEQRIPVAMHLAESPEEIELLASTSGPFRDLLIERSMWDANAIPHGTKPIDYLKVLARAPKSLAIHGNYFSSEEIEFLATERERMSVVYCPRTHAYFEHPEYPLEQMQAASVRVALGTDSRASNPDLSLLDEMRFVAARYPNIAPAKILAMGTWDGAKALGLEGQVGSIAPGKWADLITVAWDSETQEPESAVLHGNQRPRQIWLRGQLQ